MTESAPHPPLPAARRALILEALARRGVVRNSQLIEEFGVTPVTVRRDLAQLEHEGLLDRVHGGAVSAERPAALGTRDGVSADAPGTIAMLVPSLDYSWPAVVRGVEAEARRQGFRVLLRGASYELHDERPALERLVEIEHVRGLIVAPNMEGPHARDLIQWLAGCGVPSVLAERDAVVLPHREPAESVTTDHALGGMLAARHLAGLGHRKVGLVVSRSSPTSRKIAAGWDAACRELGIPAAGHFKRVLPERGSPEFSPVVEGILETALASGTTGLLVHSDLEAMAFVDLALARGIGIPEDLSLIAYDDEVAELVTPALTAVSPPRAAVGEAAADLLVRRLAEPGRAVRRVLLSPTLTPRESTAPPPSRAV
ncbi:substrate-binding domain-containing protein [Microbacterium deminutum]|uniref:Substrate-binding domain-containing protein n=1 Tax=Microbacterium deminutum TaxID=344164 RepID=A0ABN2R2P0_9MICO